MRCPSCGTDYDGLMWCPHDGAQLVDPDHVAATPSRGAPPALPASAGGQQRVSPADRRAAAHAAFDEGRYSEAEPLLDALLSEAPSGDALALRDLNYKLGKAADAMGKSNKALACYRAAYDIDSTHLPTLTDMASLLYRMRDLDRAFKVYQTILVHHREGLSDAEIVEIFFRLGTIKLALGEHKKALNMFAKALELDPAHRDTLRAVSDLQSKRRSG